MKLSVRQFSQDADRRAKLAEKLAEAENLARALSISLSVEIEENLQPPVDANDNEQPPVTRGISGPDLAYEVLKAAGKAMKKVDLLAAIQNSGKEMSMPTLTSYLSRDDRFENVKHGFWTVKDSAGREAAASV